LHAGVQVEGERIDDVVGPDDDVVLLKVRSWPLPAGRC
jgi:hypothetical protein